MPLYCEEYVYVCVYIYIYIHTHTHIYTHIYKHISDCVQTVYELPLLPKNTATETFLHSRERCEVLTGYLSLGRRPGGGWANKEHWTKSILQSYFQTGSSGSSQLLSHFLPYRIPRVGLC